MVRKGLHGPVQNEPMVPLTRTIEKILDNSVHKEVVRFIKGNPALNSLGTFGQEIRSGKDFSSSVVGILGSDPQHFILGDDRPQLLYEELSIGFIGVKPRTDFLDTIVKVLSLGRFMPKYYYVLKFRLAIRIQCHVDYLTADLAKHFGKKYGFSYSIYVNGLNHLDMDIDYGIPINSSTDIEEKIAEKLIDSKIIILEVLQEINEQIKHYRAVKSK